MPVKKNIKTRNKKRKAKTYDSGGISKLAALTTRSLGNVYSNFKKNQELKKIKDQNFLNNFEGEWCFEKNIFKAVEGADAVVVLAEWEEYSLIEWQDISKIMRKPSWVFDCRSVVSEDQVFKANLNLWKIGDGTLS